MLNLLPNKLGSFRASRRAAEPGSFVPISTLPPQLGSFLRNCARARRPGAVMLHDVKQPTLRTMMTPVQMPLAFAAPQPGAGDTRRMARLLPMRFPQGKSGKQGQLKYRLSSSADAAEGVRSFVERRKAVFTGK
jgi:hypothetical protein